MLPDLTLSEIDPYALVELVSVFTRAAELHGCMWPPLF